MRPLLCLLLASGCIAPADDSPTGVFDHIWTDFDETYGGFDQRGIDWDAVHATYAPQVRDGMSDDALWELLTGMLAELDDGHVKLAAPGRELFDSNRLYRERVYEGTFDIEVTKTYLSDVEIGPWDGYVRGLAARGVPYVWFPWIDDNTRVLRRIAEDHPDARALILDLRHSHGGAFTYPLVAMGGMVREATPVWRSRTRNAPARGAFDAWMTWSIEPSEPSWSPPVLVLVDGETISASERMVLMTLALSDTTLIGSTTNGALATSIAREAPNGWGYQLSVQEVEAPDGTVHEGVGIPVDIEAQTTVEDIEAGRDATLERALDEV